MPETQTANVLDDYIPPDADVIRLESRDAGMFMDLTYRHEGNTLIVPIAYTDDRERMQSIIREAVDRALRQ